MHDTLYRERESLSSSHPLARVFYAKSEANCCKHVRAGQSRKAGRKLLDRTCLVLRANTMPVKLFIIKREKFSKVINLPISNTDKQGGLACLQFHHLARTVANRTDTVRLSPIYNASNKRRVLNAPASRIIIEQ